MNIRSITDRALETLQPRPSQQFLAHADPSDTALSPRAALGFSVWFGLAVGLLELACELARKMMLGEQGWVGYNQINRQYLWMIPASSLLVFGVCGVGLSLVARLWPRSSLRITVLFLCFAANLTLLLVVRSLHPIASLILSAGLAVQIAPRWLTAEAGMKRIRRKSGPMMAVLLTGLAAFSWGRDALRERWMQAHLPAAPRDAPNVLLVVLDAVRTDALSAYGARRETSPCLSKVARLGVKFESARSTAPWTLPSHAAMFTGRYPRELHTGVKTPLDAAYPTLAEFLGRRGYVTGGFVANYYYCTRSYGLDRGFLHYEDRPVSLDDVLGCSSLGRHVFPVVDALRYALASRFDSGARLGLVDFELGTHRRTAAEINRALLQWLPRPGTRPFFAFLNYYDAHAPYRVPPNPRKPFGLQSENWTDYVSLRDWDARRMQEHASGTGKRTIAPREETLARDGYDDCIAYIDQQLGNLFHDLKRRGQLENTLVAITADHGEEFGEHNLYGHSVSMHRAELDVPLLLFLPGRVPDGRVVPETVSLRDLPATVLDLLGCVAPSPFPGRSLARFWRPTGEPGAGSEPAFSEMSEYGLRALRDGTLVYMETREGFERLFDLKTDPGEERNLIGEPAARHDLERFRTLMAKQGPRIPLEDRPVNR